MASSKHYDSGLQYLPADTPIDDITYLLKRDGGVVLRSLISDEELDKTYDEIKDRIDQDLEWDGEFFPSMPLFTLLPFILRLAVTLI
jgi:hypothetical protein